MKIIAALIGMLAISPAFAQSACDCKTITTQAACSANTKCWWHVSTTYSWTLHRYVTTASCRPKGAATC